MIVQSVRSVVALLKTFLEVMIFQWNLRSGDGMVLEELRLASARLDAKFYPRMRGMQVELRM